MGFYDFMTHFYARLREHVILALGDLHFHIFKLLLLGIRKHTQILFSPDCFFKIFKVCHPCPRSHVVSA